LILELRGDLRHWRSSVELLGLGEARLLGCKAGDLGLHISRSLRLHVASVGRLKRRSSIAGWILILLLWLRLLRVLERGWLERRPPTRLTAEVAVRPGIHSGLLRETHEIKNDALVTWN